MGEPMMRIVSLASKLWLLFTVAAVSVWAQPQANAVTNAADYTPTLAPGMIAALFGANMADAPAYPSGSTLPTTLNGVSVTVNGNLSPLFYVSPTQIDFQVPFEVAAGTANLVVTVAGHQSNSLQCVVAPFSLGIFQAGGGYGAIQNPDHAQNSAQKPAASSSVIVVYVTGIGVTDTHVADGAAGPASPPARFAGTPTATIGDADAPVQFVGLTPGFVGLGQANIQVPAVPSGVYPLRISLNGIQSASALVAVKGNGNAFDVADLLKLESSFSLPGVGPTQVPGISGVVANSLAVLGSTLYVCSPADIKLVDVSSPTAPVFLQRITDGQLSNSAHNCTINSSVAKPFLLNLVRVNQSIALYDLSSPAEPVKITQYSLRVVPRSVAYSGSTAFFGEDLFTPSGHQVVRTQGHMVSVDLSNPHAPVSGPLVQFDSAHPETNTTNLKPYMIVPAAGVLYAASTTASQTFDPGTAALDIFDTTDPKNIRGIGQMLVPGSKILLTLTAQGNELLAVGDTTGFSPGNTSPLDFPFTGFVTLTMFDITDPRKPIMQGNVIVNTMRPGNIGGAISMGAVALGSGFYAVSCAAPDLNATGGGGNNSLVIVDARDPGNPRAYTYGTFPGLGGLDVANGYLYAAVGSGANIYKIQLP